MNALARTVAAVAGMEWAWTADELEGLVAAAGWIYRAPSEGTVNCTFDASPGRAGAFLFGAEVTAVYLSLHDKKNLVLHDKKDLVLHHKGDLRAEGDPSRREGEDAGVPARRDRFVAAIAQVALQLGPPRVRCPGPDPSAGWRVAAGVLEVVDRPEALDLWLRPAPRRVPLRRVPPVDGDVDWPALERGLAAAVASLPAGAHVRLEARGRTNAETDGVGTLVELRQTEDSLTVRAGDETETMRWPAAGEAYRKVAGRLVILLREKIATPADLAYRSDLPVPYLPLRRA
ncbi:hypothetical protein [Actinoplanes xinjiangensis]|uniref:hypothetical protein n=1 Tax=Actinoplanes xinjiangensis TaxID=512350 RepID=UPI00343C3FC3